jgi:hypothetical protein
MPSGLEKKLGPLKVWQWALIGAALGAAIVIYRRGKPEGEAAGEVFGGTGTGAFGAIDPETGIPYQFEGGAGGGESLDTFLANIGKLSDAGLLPIDGEGRGPGEPDSETIITEIVKQANQGKKQREKRSGSEKTPATSTGGAAAAGGASHASAPHPATRIASIAVGGAKALTGPNAGQQQQGGQKAKVKVKVNSPVHADGGHGGGGGGGGQKKKHH